MNDFHYSVCTGADEAVFHRQCDALERHIPTLIKIETLVDIDGSITQVYRKGNARISVHNSNYIGAVYVDSDIDLKPFFVS